MLFIFLILKKLSGILISTYAPVICTPGPYGAGE